MSDVDISYASPGELLGRLRKYRVYPDRQIDRLFKSIKDLASTSR